MIDSQPSWFSFAYRDFYDLPRAIVVSVSEVNYFLDCPFDEDQDEYPKTYVIYRLPYISPDELKAMNWEDMAAMGKRLGEITVSEVEFDASKRKSLRSLALERLIKLDE